MSTCRVFVNGAGFDLPEGSTAVDAVRASDPAEAESIAAGHRVITDSRGLPVAASAPVFAGAILRTVRAPKAPSAPPER